MSKPEIKKRGRKPNGGKIIDKKQKIEEPIVEIKTNIILHLKCFLKDLNSTNSDTTIEPYDEDTNYYNTIKDIETSPEKNLNKKIKELEYNLHTNNINDNKYVCFHCTYSFDNNACYIPKAYMNDGYQVYGCFCSPECSVAYLFNENISSCVKFERYSMLNHIYGKAYDYQQPIKPALNPHYSLEKYCGNLTIQEYRSLFRSDRYFLIVDKPLTRVMPELYEYNNEHIINNKFMNTNLKLKQTKKPNILQP